MNVPLRICGLNEEQPMQASKWLKSQVLLDADEMKTLLSHLEEQAPLSIFFSGCIVKPGEGFIPKIDFIERYTDYIDQIKNGQIPKNEEYRHWFSSVFTTTPEALYAMAINDKQHLIRVSRPVIQLQAHSFDYSVFDGKFRPMIFGNESILWGIQFSYPQIYQNLETNDVEQVVESEFFPNTKLFRSIQKWLRQNTIPTPFIVGEKTTNVPMRIGKNCLAWINKHPQLIKKNIQVKV